jgi:iron complex outermembrane receptor protein
MRSIYKKAAAIVAATAISIAAPFAAKAAETAKTTTDTTADDTDVFTLGTLLVTGEASSDVPATNDSISAARMQELNRTRVSTALETLPGINIMPGNRGGARNETGVYLRGFDLSRVPVLLDGIPIYVPYDGYVDLNRLTTFDLSKIEVSKGFASVLDGPNAMGGEINLVTRRPTKALEGNVELGADFAGNGDFKGYRVNANAGSRIDDWYLQGGISKITQKFYRLSDDFQAGLYQPTGQRIHSESDDENLRLKIGVTPRPGDEYAVGVSAGRAEKQAPPYAGLDATKAVFFDWPRYDQQSVYYTGQTQLGDGGSYLKTRLYYNAMQNALKKYDNSTYTTQFFGSSFSSQYNDYTVGGSAELGLALSDQDQLAFSAALKNDTHKEANVGGPTSRMEDVTSSVAVQYTTSFNDKLSGVLGAGYDYRDPRSAQDPSTGGVSSFNVKSQDAFNYQGGLTYKLADDQSVYASASHKTRFATMYERYSYRLGFGQPNPSLRPEQSTNFELGYKGRVASETMLTVAPFASKVTDYIQAATVGFSAVPFPHSITQAQNVGSGWFYGVETTLDTKLLPRTDAQIGYTYLQRRITGLYGTPSHTVFAAASVDVGDGFSVTPSALYQSKRTTIDTGNGLPIGGDLVANLNGAYAIDASSKIEVGVKNIFDRNYYYDDGYPAEGRNFSVTYRYTF